MRSFWFNDYGNRIEIIFNLIKNGRWWYHPETKARIGVEFDHPYPENDDSVQMGFVDIEDLDPAVRSMLFQSLQLDAPEFDCSYS